MIYESLTYVNSRGDSVFFGVGGTYHTNIIRDASGQGDISDTIYSTSSLGQHGDTFQGVKIEPKEIKINGKIKASSYANQLKARRKLTSILNPMLAGTLYYTFGDYVKKIGAIVDGSPKYSHPDLTEVFDITFKCLDPFWRDETTNRKDVASWIADWIFPTVILRDDSRSMIYGHRETSLIVDVFNKGVSSGMTIQFRALGELTNPSLTNVNTYEYIKVNYTMQAGDVITVNTGYGEKSIALLRSGVETNIYRYMDIGSTFLQLDIGDNLFRYNAETGLSNLEVTVFYDQKYLGV